MKNSSWLLIGFPISLKKSENSAVVVGSTGEVTYHPASGDSMAAQEGAVLPISGAIELKAGSKVTLFYDGKRYTFDTEGRHNLSRKLTSGGGALKLKKGFGKKFEKQLMMAFATTSRSVDDDKGGAIGWGARSIMLITPVDTTVGEGEVLFIWADRSDPSDAEYTFQLFRSGSDTPIMQTTLKQKKLSVNLADFDPEEGEEFCWMVSSGDNLSEKAYFTYSQESKKATKTLAKVRDEKVYQQADETEKLLMEAVALQEAGLSHQAFQKLNEAASRFPGNRLVEGMMNSFMTQMKQQK